MNQSSRPHPDSTLIIVAGLSGAGKSTALHALEDLGFFVLDNLPVSLFENFLTFRDQEPLRYRNAVILFDIREEDETRSLLQLYRKIQGQASKRGEQVAILFLECRNQVIQQRYSETRRPHPRFLPTQDSTIEKAIIRERSLLEPMRTAAHQVVDTSDLTVHALRRSVKDFVDSLNSSSESRLRVNIVSFGFKYGPPFACDLLIDVRFLPNPHYVQGLRSQTGLDNEVRDYVFKFPQTEEFLEKYCDLLKFLLPHYSHEGKSYLNIGVGCTGGKHRSVAIVEELTKRANSKEYLFSTEHRDIER